MMKVALLAAATMVAMPAFAQTQITTPGTPTVDSAKINAPPSGQTMTPPASDPSMPAPAAPPADPAMAPATPMAAPATPMAAPADTSTAPMASTGKLPWCRAGQFTGCRERSNAKGEGLRKN